jgi:predicted ArsR family transcriptional regulator
MTVRVTVESVSSDPQALSAVAVLADDLRRRMYEFIRRADGPVTRDEAAAAVGISRKLAAFHLDKLVDAGLLEAGFARPAGLRRAGRASKVYAPADVDVQVSIPPRPGRLGAERALTLASETLERYGFEPARAEPTRVFLRNCPFQPLAAHAPDLVCAVNQAFLAGFLRGLGASTATAALTRPPGACCVELLAASTG